MDPVDVADDGAVGHGGVVAVVVVGAAEGLRLLHVDVAHVVVERGDLGGGEPLPGAVGDDEEEQEAKQLLAGKTLISGAGQQRAPARRDFVNHTHENQPVVSAVELTDCLVSGQSFFSSSSLLLFSGPHE